MQLQFTLLNSSTLTHFCQYDLEQKHTEVTAEHENITDICQILHFYHKSLIHYMVCIWGKNVLWYCDRRLIPLKLNCWRKEERNWECRIKISCCGALLSWNVYQPYDTWSTELLWSALLKERSFIQNISHECHKSRIYYSGILSWMCLRCKNYIWSLYVLCRFTVVGVGSGFR